MGRSKRQACCNSMLIALLFMLCLSIYAQDIIIESGQQFVDASRSLAGPTTLILKGVINVTEADLFRQPVQGFMSNGTLQLIGNSDGSPAVLDLGNQFEVSVSGAAWIDGLHLNACTRPPAATHMR